MVGARPAEAVIARRVLRAHPGAKVTLIDPLPGWAPPGVGWLQMRRSAVNARLRRVSLTADRAVIGRSVERLTWSSRDQVWSVDGRLDGAAYPTIRASVVHLCDEGGPDAETVQIVVDGVPVDRAGVTRASQITLDGVPNASVCGGSPLGPYSWRTMRIARWLIHALRRRRERS